METNPDTIAVDDVTKKISEQNGDVLEQISVRVAIDNIMLKKMKSLASLYPDELDSDAKRPDLVAFFLRKGFEALVASGEFEKRLKGVLAE